MAVSSPHRHPSHELSHTQPAGRVQSSLPTLASDDANTGRVLLRTPETNHLSGLWAILIAICVVSTRYILVEKNYHYPSHLLLLHLSAALATAILRDWFIRPSANLGWAWGTLPWSFWIGACTAAVALLSFIQALLHYPNLPTLAMLSVIAWLVIGLMTRVSNQESEYKCSEARLLALTIACTLLLYDEYRLTVNGIAFLLTAMLSAGCSKYCLARKPSDSDETQSLDLPLLYLTICIAMILSLPIAWMYEYGERSTASLGDIFSLVCLNVVAIVTVTTCRGPLAVIFMDQPSGVGTTEVASNHVLSVGLIGLGATLLSMPVYATHWQLLAYLTGAVGLLPVAAWNFATIALADIVAPPRIQWKMNGLDLVRQGLLSGQKTTRQALKDQTLTQKLGRVFTIVVWVSFILKNFRSWGPPAEVHLDSGYSASTRLEVVISMFDESPELIRRTMGQLRQIPAIAAARPSLTVYNKLEGVDLQSLAAETGATEVYQIRNRGREGETYLYHILTHWDRLARHTLFIQAHVHNQRELFPRIRDYFVDETGMLSLGFSGTTCDCNDCGDRWGWTDKSGIIPKLYGQVYGQSCENSPVLLSYKGQFIVSAARIRGIDRNIYQDLHTALTDESSWAHQEAYLEGRPDSLNAPFLGFTLERMWDILMQCDDARIASMCPTLISGQRRGGGISDCQCLDPESNGMGDVSFELDE